MSNKRKKSETKNTLAFLNTVRADALTGFIAGFLVGVMGMYVYVVILTTSPV